MLCRECGEDKPEEAFQKTPNGRRRKCKVCVQLRQKAWNAKNSSHVNAEGRKRYAENIEQERSRSRAYANSDHGRSVRRANYEAKRDEKVAYSSDWMHQNRERYRQNQRAARARSYGVTESERYTTEDVHKKSGGKCGGCGKSWSLDEYGRNGWVIDHIVPHVHGGPDVLANTQVMCQPCNAIKSKEEANVR